MSQVQNNAIPNTKKAMGICRGRCILNNKHYLCIVEYHNKHLVVKQLEGFIADNLIKTGKIICSRHRLPSKIVLDADKNCISEKFKRFSQVTQHTSCSVIIIQPSEQKAGRGMHINCQKNHEEMLSH